jgi:hypothetical protein
MLYRIVAAVIIIFSFIIVFLALGASAVGMNVKGLAISPTRQNLTAPPHELTNGSFKIKNGTLTPITVTLSIKQFSATDYTYDETFSTPKDDWIRLGKTQIKLEPGEDSTINFTANVPTNATPGGHYFAFYASSDLTQGTFKQTAQVVSLLYMKVTGKIIRAGNIQDGSAPILATGSDIPFRFNAKNTGNIDFSANFFGQLVGLFGVLQQTNTEHELLPGTIRSIGGSVPAPLLPGIYKLTYGYQAEFDKTVTTKTTYILYIPLWSIAALIVALFIGQRVWQQRLRKQA